MAISRGGIKQMVLCDGGSMATSPVDPIAMGIRTAAPFKRSPYKPITDYLNRKWRNMTNIRAEAESYQPTMHMINKHISWLNMNCDAQILSRPQAAGGAGDCYKFIGNHQLGLDFELMISSDKRSLKSILEGAFPYEDVKAFVDTADSETPVSFSGITGAGEDQTLFRRPFFLSFEFPKATSVLTRAEIAERSYSIKTKNKKSNENNTSIVDYLSVEIMMKFRNASVAKQVEIMSKDNSPSLFIKEQNNGSFYDAFDFNAGVLTLDEDFDDGDEDRVQTLRFTGDIFVFDVSFEFGASSGGDAADTKGEKGGTMKFGY